MYRIKVILLLFIAILFGCDGRALPDRADKLDEGLVTQLMAARVQAIRSHNSAEVKGFYSPDVIVDVTDAAGLMSRRGYRGIRQQAEMNEAYVLDYQYEVLERVVFVSNNQQRAVVQQRTREVWLFREKYNDIEVESVNRFVWELEADVPQIVEVSKRVLDHVMLSEDRTNIDSVVYNDA